MIRIGILGGSGYVASELVRLLAGHPQAALHVIASRKPGGRVCDVHPGLIGLPKVKEMRFDSLDSPALDDCDIVFLALPSGEAMRRAPKLLENGARVLDLSADYRLRDAQVWARWYGMRHESPELLTRAVYGLPELVGGVGEADLVACPGCYPTATLLAAAPLLRAPQAGIPSALYVSAASGVSGAGRRAEERYAFVTREANFCAYGAEGHRHLPEIESQARILAEREVSIAFVPHLVPMQRGLHVTLFAAGLHVDVEELQSRYQKFYSDCPCVEVLPLGESPQTAAMRGGNLCALALAVAPDRRTVIVCSAIDNLVKGAAGQAVQCMNRMIGCEETLGLPMSGLFP